RSVASRRKWRLRHRKGRGLRRAARGLIGTERSGLHGVGVGCRFPPPTAPSGRPPNGEGGATAALPNPGTFEECHRRCKELFPVQMEGVKLTVNKGLSNHFQVNHTVALSTVGDSAYHFGATYVGGQQIGPNEAFPVLVGSMDGSGSLSAQLLHLLTPACAPSWPAR
uniref:Mitochondrial import receptor subunit TOM40 homolog n=1 Tax=Gallus gallus TaxID=9031 RepID=A0A8V0X8B1_CHICK